MEPIHFSSDPFTVCNIESGRSSMHCGNINSKVIQTSMLIGQAGTQDNCAYTHNHYTPFFGVCFTIVFACDITCTTCGVQLGLAVGG